MLSVNKPVLAPAHLTKSHTLLRTCAAVLSCAALALSLMPTAAFAASGKAAATLAPGDNASTQAATAAADEPQAYWWGVEDSGTTLVISGAKTDTATHEVSVDDQSGTYTSTAPWGSSGAIDVSKIRTVQLSGAVVPVSMCSWFSGFSNLVQLRGLENLNTGLVENMNDLFNKCSSLERLDLTSFDTKGLRFARNMFRDCSGLKAVDLSTFDTAGIPIGNALYMFSGASQLIILKLGEGWATSFAYSVSDGGSLALRETPWTSLVNGTLYPTASIQTGVADTYYVSDEVTKIDVPEARSYLYTGTALDLVNGSMSYTLAFDDGQSFEAGVPANAADVGRYRITASPLVETGKIALWSDGQIGGDYTGLVAAILPNDKGKVMKTEDGWAVTVPQPPETGSITTNNAKGLQSAGITGLEGLSYTNWALALHGTEYIAVDISVTRSGSDAWQNLVTGTPGLYTVTYTARGNDALSTSATLQVTDGIYAVLKTTQDNTGVLTLRDGISNDGGNFVPIMPGDTSVPWENRKAEITDVVVEEGIAPTSLAGWFSGCVNLTNVDFSGLDSSLVTSSERLFDGCTSLSTLKIKTQGSVAQTPGINLKESGLPGFWRDETSPGGTVYAANTQGISFFPDESTSTVTYTRQKELPKPQAVNKTYKGDQQVLYPTDGAAGLVVRKAPEDTSALVVENNEAKATTVGSYKALVAPAEGYVWTDGTCVKIPVDLNMSKMPSAERSVSIALSEIVLIKGSPAFNVELNLNDGRSGENPVIKENNPPEKTSVVKRKINGSSLVLTPMTSEDSVTVSVWYKDTDNCEESAVATIDVTVFRNVSKAKEKIDSLLVGIEPVGTADAAAKDAAVAKLDAINSATGDAGKQAAVQDAYAAARAAQAANDLARAASDAQDKAAGDAARRALEAVEPIVADGTLESMNALADALREDAVVLEALDDVAGLGDAFDSLADKLAAYGQLGDNVAPDKRADSVSDVVTAAREAQRVAERLAAEALDAALSGAKEDLELAGDSTLQAVDAAGELVKELESSQRDLDPQTQLALAKAVGDAGRVASSEEMPDDGLIAEAIYKLTGKVGDSSISNDGLRKAAEELVDAYDASVNLRDTVNEAKENAESPQTVENAGTAGKGALDSIAAMADGQFVDDIVKREDTNVKLANAASEAVDALSGAAARLAGAESDTADGALADAVGDLADAFKQAAGNKDISAKDLQDAAEAIAEAAQVLVDAQADATNADKERLAQAAKALADAVGGKPNSGTVADALEDFKGAAADADAAAEQLKEDAGDAIAAAQETLANVRAAEETYGDSFDSAKTKALEAAIDELNEALADGVGKTVAEISARKGDLETAQNSAVKEITDAAGRVLKNKVEADASAAESTANGDATVKDAGRAALGKIAALDDDNGAFAANVMGKEGAAPALAKLVGEAVDALSGAAGKLRGAETGTGEGALAGTVGQLAEALAALAGNDAASVADVDTGAQAVKDAVELLLDAQKDATDADKKTIAGKAADLVSAIRGKKSAGEIGKAIEAIEGALEDAGEAADQIKADAEEAITEAKAAIESAKGDVKKYVGSDATDYKGAEVRAAQDAVDALQNALAENSDKTVAEVEALAGALDAAVSKMKDAAVYAAMDALAKTVEDANGKATTAAAGEAAKDAGKAALDEVAGLKDGGLASNARSKAAAAVEAAADAQAAQAARAAGIGLAESAGAAVDALYSAANTLRDADSADSPDGQLAAEVGALAGALSTLAANEGATVANLKTAADATAAAAKLLANAKASATDAGKKSLAGKAKALAEAIGQRKGDEAVNSALKALEDAAADAAKDLEEAKKDADDAISKANDAIAQAEKLAAESGIDCSEEIAAARQAIKDLQDALKEAADQGAAVMQIYNTYMTRLSSANAALAEKAQQVEEKLEGLVLGKVYDVGGAETNVGAKAGTDTSTGRYKVTKLGATREVAYTSPTLSSVTPAAATPVKTVAVPDTVTISGITLNVVSVGSGALKGQTSLANVSIGSNVRSIDANAFQNCGVLAGVNVAGNNLTSIGASAFQGCKKLVGANFASAKLGTVGANAFKDCTALKSVTLKSTAVRSIGTRAFQNCSALGKVAVNGSALTAVAADSFANCKSMTQVTIKSTKLTTIGKRAFKGCTKLKKVTLGTKKLKTVSANAFQNCKALAKMTVKGSALTSIGARAFKGDKKLKTVTLSSTKLKTIGKQAFNGCKKLKKLTVKSTKLKKVGAKAFKGDKKLKTVKVPKKKVAAYKKIFKKGGVKTAAVKK